MPASRRSLLLGGIAAATLAACARQNDKTSPGASPSPSTPSAGAGTSTTSASANFPVSIKHTYGTTEITTKPERIATVTWSNSDTLLALGVVPVGMPAVAYGGNKNKSTDWADAKLDELGAGWGSPNAPKLYSEADGVNFDEMAALKPDLIISGYSGITQDDYDKLTKIAPTIGPIAPNFTTAWDELTLAVGQAIGKPDEAAALKKSLIDAMADVGKQNPAVAKSTFIAGMLDTAHASNNSTNIYSPQDSRSQFLMALGMQVADVVTKSFEGKKEFFLPWSNERVDELVSDIFLSTSLAPREKLQQDTFFKQIPSVKAGNVLAPTEEQTVLAMAINALTIPWLIENVVPELITIATKAQG